MTIPPYPLILPDRGVLRLGGPDRVAFLQGLVSNDVTAVAPGRAVYACLLTPQGKFLHDFIMIADGDSILIDCEEARRDDLLKRLRIYRLRSKVEFSDATEDFAVFAGEATEGAIGFLDPRHPALGQRFLASPGQALASTGSYDAYDRLRIALAVPDGSRDMEVGKAILLENNIDLLNGIAWDKGCYMGQELTARTRYRGLVKKRLVPVRIDGLVPANGSPLIWNGIEIGEMRGANGELGLALLRLEATRRTAPIDLGETILTTMAPDFLAAALAERESV